MKSARNTRFIEKSLYKLRNDYGINKIGWYHTSANSNDYTTGIGTPQVSKFSIRRAIALPMVDMRKFSYALSFLGAAGPQFSYGGYFDIRDITLIIRTKDLPSDFVRDQDDFIIIDHHRYDVQKVQDFFTERCLLVHIREVEGAKQIYEIHESNNYQYFSLSDEAIGEVV